MDNEIWKDIPEYEGFYMISSFGRIKSLKRLVGSGIIGRGNNKIINERILKPQDNGHGYMHLMLVKNYISIHFYVHRLVAISFIENPENKPTVNHINGIKSDNRVENLEWNTVSENSKHAYSIGLKTPRVAVGSKNPNTILNDDIVLDIFNYSASHSLKDTSRNFNVTINIVNFIKHKRSWKHLWK